MFIVFKKIKEVIITTKRTKNYVAKIARNEIRTDG